MLDSSSKDHSGGPTAEE